jgi:hypothetical protein
MVLMMAMVMGGDGWTHGTTRDLLTRRVPFCTHSQVDRKSDLSHRLDLDLHNSR